MPGVDKENIARFACLSGPSWDTPLLAIVEQQIFVAPSQIAAIYDAGYDELVADGAKRTSAARKKAARDCPLLMQAVETALSSPRVLLDYDLISDSRVVAAGQALGLAMRPVLTPETRQLLMRLVPYSRYKPSV